MRVSVAAGRDPLTGKQLWHRKTVKTEREAQIALGKLLEQADAGRRPDTRVTVGEAVARYMEVTQLDLSTRRTYEGYIARTILPALGSIELRKVRGPLLDTFYSRLRKCGDLSCNGKPFVEHTSFPPLNVTPDRKPAWQQVASTVREAIRSGQLGEGEQLPSAREMSDRYGVRLTSAQHALATLAKEGLIEIHQGRRSVVLPQADSAPPVRSARPAHICALSKCQPHRCKPMAPLTIKQIHAILSGTFTAAVRWEWIDRNPAATAKLPKTQPRSPSSPEPEQVAKVIAAVQALNQELLALYIWLAAVTGARRGELCALQWADLDLERGVIHVAHSYLALPGVKMRKDTKIHQDRRLAIDEITVTVLAERKQVAKDLLAAVGLELADSAYVFSHEPAGTEPWDPSWVTKKVAEIAATTGIKMTVKSLRHYSASQLLAGGIDLRNTAARLGHGGGGATTLRHYADPVSAVDRRAAAYLASLTSPPPAFPPPKQT